MLVESTGNVQHACYLLIAIDAKGIALFRESHQKVLHYNDIEVEIDGIKKEFTLRDFMERLSFPALANL